MPRDGWMHRISIYHIFTAPPPLPAPRDHASRGSSREVSPARHPPSSSRLSDVINRYDFLPIKNESARDLKADPTVKRLARWLINLSINLADPPMSVSQSSSYFSPQRPCHLWMRGLNMIYSARSEKQIVVGLINLINLNVGGR